MLVAEATQMMFRWAAGRPKVESNSARSLAMYGFPKASMMAIVSPLPVRLLGTAYALRIWDGPKHGTGLAADSGAWQENKPACGPLVFVYSGLPSFPIIAGIARAVVVVAAAADVAVTPASGIAASDAIAAMLAKAAR